MKLPPAALTAPSLCPRCDSPAVMTDFCIQCTLPLRRCGSCQGVAGPFDRYCGFCGYEMVRGRRRLPLWRLWLLAALVPLVGGIAIGVTPLAAPFSRGVHSVIEPGPPSPGTVNMLRSQALSFTYSLPKEWNAVDDALAPDPARRIPFLVVTKVGEDQPKVLDSKGDLFQLKPQAAVVAMGRPPSGSSALDSAEPEAVLAFQLAQDLQAPPAGVKVDVMRGVRRLTVGGRPAATVVLRVSHDGQSYELERAWIASPSGLFRVDILVPEADWPAGDQQRTEDVLRSIRF